MKSICQAVIVAFALISLAGCGSGAAPSTRGQTSSPVTPKPSVASSVSPTDAVATTLPRETAESTPPSAVPEDLQFRWTGPLRDVPQIAPKSNFTGLEISARTAWYDAYTQGDGPDLRSQASSSGVDELTFVTFADAVGCHPNDTGTYKYALDGTKTRLTLTAVDDPCAARTAAFSGDWTRSACPDPRGWCLGDLAPGDHQSVVFTPFTPAPSWKYDYGEMSYTVPGGWSNTEDAPGGYALQQQNAPEFTAIYLFADVLAHLQQADCAELPDMSIGSSAADLTDYLTDLPSVTTTEPNPVTIGGLTGSTVDVSIDPGWTQTCAFSQGSPAAQLFSNDDPRHQFDWGLSGDGHMRLLLLELPNDRTLLIDIESTDAETWDALLPEAMPVVDSFSFRTP